MSDGPRSNTKGNTSIHDSLVIKTKTDTEAEIKKEGERKDQLLLRKPQSHPWGGGLSSFLACGRDSRGAPVCCLHGLFRFWGPQWKTCTVRGLTPAVFPHSGNKNHSQELFIQTRNQQIHMDASQRKENDASDFRSPLMIPSLFIQGEVGRTGRGSEGWMTFPRDTGRASHFTSHRCLVWPVCA